MTRYTTPDLNLSLPTPGTGEQHSQAVDNANLEKLDTRSASLRTQLTAVEGRVSQIETPTLLPYAQYTTLVNGASDNTLYNQGTLARTVPVGYDDSFVAIDGNASGSTTSSTEPRLKFTKKGLYMVMWAVSSNLPIQGRSFIEMRVNGAGKGRTNFGGGGEDSLVGNWLVAAPADTGTVFQVWFYKNAGVSNFSGILTIAKVA